MKTALLTATYLVGIGELILAGYFWKTRSGQEIRKIMTVFALATGIWVISSALVSYRESSFFVDVNVRIIFIAGALLLTSLLRLAILLPYKTFTFDRLHAFLLYVPVLLITYMMIVGETIVRGYQVTPHDVGVVIPGPLYSMYNGYLLLVYLASLWILLMKYRSTDGSARRLTELVLWSIIIGGLPAVLIDLIIPLFSDVYINSLTGNLFTAVWLGVTSYIVIKK